MALGAKNRSIVRLVVRQILWPVTIGAALGVGAAGPIGKALTAGPIQLNPFDPAAYAAALVVFLAAALLAALWPAFRVIKADPIQSLRHW
jgi:ABC-type antimicrobial peptide transport system permease subunit